MLIPLIVVLFRIYASEQSALGAMRCELCGEHEDDCSERHLDGLEHRLNYLLFEREHKRGDQLRCDQIFIDQSIVLDDLNNIQVEYVNDKGLFITKLKCCMFEELSRKLSFKFTIRNDRDDQMWIVVHTLHPLDNYFISDFNHDACTQLEFVLEKGEQWSFLLTFHQEITTIGTYKLPIAITIQPKTNPVAYKTVYRDVEISIGDLEICEVAEGRSPFKKDEWPKLLHVVDCNKKFNRVEEYPIPTHYLLVFVHGLKTFIGESEPLQQFRLQTLEMWQKGLNESNYADFFHRLLWLEECTQVMGIRQYNMSDVRVKLLRNKVVLQVPGLAEKRPSVLRGDFVLLRLSNELLVYKGVVEMVEDESLIIEDLDKEILTILEAYPTSSMDVSFVLARLQLERMHAGVNNCVKNGMFCSLFPTRPLNRAPRRALLAKDLCNKAIAHNPQQLMAVESILSGASQRAPYIIFGPPGTGKTVTLVEAILQVKKQQPGVHILVCAPSNAACDMLALKLDEQLSQGGGQRKPKDVLRLHTCSRNANDVPKAVKYFSNLDGGEFYEVRAYVLRTYTIVISTLHLIGKYAGDYSPDMAFIDEAAQTTEPECDIAIGLLSPGKPIVLAGDPKQLGPVCGALSGRMGLARSLLDRFMESVELYLPTRQSPLAYDGDFITMLVRNYRSHEDITAVPNALFYAGSLQFDAHEDPVTAMAIAPHVLGGKPANAEGAGVEFIGLLSNEQRNGHSPSYYNVVEMEAVLKVIDYLLEVVNVAQNEIGVIAPYIRQVVQIRKKLEADGRADIQVGTTEAFQGGERRVMIISTVRAKSDLLLYDKKYDLGFVKHERRFNVAITRAQAKLIIIGNPHLLAYDAKCWGAMMEHCQQLNSYFGEDVRRDNPTREKILRNITRSD